MSGDLSVPQFSLPTPIPLFSIQYNYNPASSFMPTLYSLCINAIFSLFVDDLDPLQDSGAEVSRPGETAAAGAGQGA